jgi:hypothetical protein
MDFADVPTIYIEHNDETHPFPTVQTDDDFIFSLRLQFGKDCPPDNKKVILIGEKDGPDQRKKEISIPLSTVLQNQMSYTKQALKLRFVDLPPVSSDRNIDRPNLTQQAGFQARKENSSAPSAEHHVTPADVIRAQKLKKGRMQGKKKDKNGDIITSVGQNNDLLLTRTEKTELQKYVLFHWKLDEKTGVPLLQTDQPDRAEVELSLFEAKKNPVLKNRPYAALRRYAQK